MSEWDYNTKKIWGASEVMQELEKDFYIRRNAGINDTVEKTKKNLEEANTSASKLLKNLGEQSFAKDDEEKEEDCEGVINGVIVVEDPKDGDLVITEEEYVEAKNNLLEELIALSYEAIAEENIKLAYTIERIVDEIREEY